MHAINFFFYFYEVYLSSYCISTSLTLLACLVFIDESPLHSKAFSHPIPALETVIESDFNTGKIQFNVTVPRRNQRSASFSYDLIPIEETPSSQGPNQELHHFEKSKQIISFDEEDLVHMKPLCITSFNPLIRPSSGLNTVSRVDDSADIDSDFNSAPTMKTLIESDHDTGEVKFKMTVPVSKHIKCSVDFSRQFIPTKKTSLQYPSRKLHCTNQNKQILSPDQEFLTHVKPLCITSLNPPIYNSSAIDLCVDGNIDLPSDCCSSSPSTVSQDQSSSYSEVSCSPEVLPTAKKRVLENTKRRLPSSSSAPSLKKRKNEHTDSELQAENSNEKVVNSKIHKKHATSIQASISKLNKSIQQLPNIKDCDFKQTLLTLESIQKDLLTLKGKNLSVSTETHEELLKCLGAFINTDESLVDEKRKFVSKNIYRVIMLSAESVFTIVSSYSQDLRNDDLTISQMALFLFINFFNSLLPVLQNAGKADETLSEANFDKVFGNHSFKRLLNKFEEIVSASSKVPELFSGSDDAFVKLASVCISALFTPNLLNFQHSSLKLMTSFYATYEGKRPLILDQIISTIALLNRDVNFTQRTFKVSHSDSQVQFITAALLSFVNATASFLRHTASPKLIKKCFSIKLNEAQKLWHEFFNKMICNSVSNSNFRTVLENLILDLFKIRYEPEWPASNSIFRFLHKLIAFHLTNTSNKNIQNVCFDYLALLLPVFREDFVMRASIQNKLSQIFTQDSQSNASADLTSMVYSNSVCCLKLVVQSLAGSKNVSSLEGLTEFYCMILIEEIIANIDKLKGKISKLKSIEGLLDESLSFVYAITNHLPENKSSCIVSKPILSNPKDEQIFKTIARYLNSSNPLVTYSDKLLKLVINRVVSANPQMQLKAIKCMFSVVEADPNLLFYSYIEISMKRSLTDPSCSLREKAVQFLGKQIFINKQIFEKYFPCILERVQDVRLTVRKATLSIIFKLFFEDPQYPGLSNLLVTILKRLDDDPTIVKAIIDFFKQKWIVPLNKKNESSTLPTVLDILSTLQLSRQADTTHKFPEIFKSLLNTSDCETKDASCKAAKRITKCILNQILKDSASNVDMSVNCYQMLLIFVSAKSEMAADLTPTLYPHLCSKLTMDERPDILHYVLSIFEHLMLYRVSFFKNVEKKSFLIKQFVILINSGKCKNVLNSISCLSLISKINNDFSSAQKIFSYCQNLLTNLCIDSCDKIDKLCESEALRFNRILIKLSALIRYFDLPKILDKECTPANMKKIVNIFICLLTVENSNVRAIVIKSIALISGRYQNLLLKEEVVKHFCSFLESPNLSNQMKVRVLLALSLHFQEDNRRAKSLNDNWLKISKEENLKEMKDVSAGTSSVIANRYLPSILSCFLVKDLHLRYTAVKTLKVIVDFKLIHPANFMSYSICMIADPEPSISRKALDMVVNIQSCGLSLLRPFYSKGVLQSHKLLEITSTDKVVRGFAPEQPTARFSKLFEVLSKDTSVFVSNLVSQFTNHDELNLKLLLYIADNLAHFPYKEIPDVLFVLSKISSILSNDAVPYFEKIKEVLAEYKKRRRGKANVVNKKNKSEEILPLPPNQLLCLCETGFVFILLLQLWHFLKSSYSVSDKLVLSYLCEGASKMKKLAIRKSQKELFNPESLIVFLQSDHAPSLASKENPVDVHFIETLKVLASEFEELSFDFVPKDVED
nr:PREDICTED: nipped-B-like protein [Bemisia tabaci]